MFIVFAHKSSTIQFVTFDNRNTEAEQLVFARDQPLAARAAELLQLGTGARSVHRRGGARGGVRRVPLPLPAALLPQGEN